MPEGHSVHRIAQQFTRSFVGQRVAVSSPQGRFAAGAALLDGHTMTSALAVGKQMFLSFEGERVLRVHLGIYGAWDFAGDIELDATAASAGGRIGQTNQHGTDPELLQRSLGAPRTIRAVRMGEHDDALEAASFPPPPVGQVRARLLTDTAVADLRGPTACEVIDPEREREILDRLGPDPVADPGPDAEAEFVARARRKGQPIAVVLMDQSVVAGIGNVYRAEMLFRARQNPFTPAKELPEQRLAALWRDWAHLLPIGIQTGQMLTRDDLTGDAYVGALAHLDERHWVYQRQGLPCRVCGATIEVTELASRKLYWCPSCQR